MAQTSRLDVATLVQCAGEHVEALDVPVVQARHNRGGIKKRAPLRRKGSGWEGSKDPQQVLEWFTESPAHDQLGAQLAGTRYVVLDVDWHDELGALGMENLHRLCVEAGVGTAESLIGGTAYAYTPGSGMHVWFKAPDGWPLVDERKIAALPKLDLLCGGFVMLPPSCPAGTLGDALSHYRWVRSPLPAGSLTCQVQGTPPEAEGVPVAMLPPTLAALLLEAVERTQLRTGGGAGTAGGSGKTADGRDFQAVLDGGSDRGSRNDDLVSLVGWLRRRVGDTPEAHAEIRSLIEAWRDRCRPPYRGVAEDEEVERSWQSALKLEHSNFYGDVGWPAAAGPSRGHNAAGSPLAGAVAGWGSGQDAALLSFDAPGLADFVEAVCGDALSWCKEQEQVYHFMPPGVWVPEGKTGQLLYDSLVAPRADGGYGVMPALSADVQMQQETRLANGDRAGAAEIARWWKRYTIKSSMLEAARTVAARQAQGRVMGFMEYDAQPDWLACRNGWVDLRSGAVISHAEARGRGWRNMRLVDVDYTPGARSTRWEETLELMLPGDPEMQGYLQRALGVSLFGDNRSKSCFVLHGDANNGKSTLFRVLSAVLGRYMASGAREVFVEPRNKVGSAADKHLTGLADATEHRIVYLPEYSEHEMLNADTIKKLTGGDLVTVRRLYQDQYEAEPRCTPWIISNHRVILGSFGPAVKNRVKLIELPGEIPLDKRKEIAVVLNEHRSPEVLEAILAWLVNGAMEYQTHGMQEPARVGLALEELEHEQNPVLVWLKDDVVGRGGEVLTWEQCMKEKRGASRAAVYAHYVSRSGIYGGHAFGEERFAKALRDALLPYSGKSPSADYTRWKENGEAVRHWPIVLPPQDAPEQLSGWRP